jgi:ubiquinone/menaquinone biosynthesis C-methylase UbiE
MRTWTHAQFDRKSNMTQATGAMTEPEARALPVPGYLQQLYWWAYIHPRAVRLFEREWLVNIILLGNYHRLREACLDGLGEVFDGSTLQLGCVYGNLSARLQDRLAPGARLDVVDILKIQLDNLARKLPRRGQVRLIQGDASALACADGAYDRVLIFFLLHEQPEAVRRRTIAEALRVTRPGGRLVIIDYHRPQRWHPLRPLVQFILRRLKPYAADLWREELGAYFPPGFAAASLHQQTYFGGLYQMLAITR